jgi:FkbM family methyltransferase
MRRIHIDLATTRNCKRQLAQERRDHPFFGIVDLRFTSAQTGSVEIKMIDLNDDYVARSFSGEDCYEPLMIDAWLKAAAACRGTILDIGASTGLYSLLASKVNRGVRVLAFEPYSRAVSRLVNNKDLNVLPKIEIHAAAASTACGVGELLIRNFEGPITTGGSLLDNGSASARVPIVLTQVQDVLPAEARVDLIKIDVEGHELAVLEGLSRLLDSSRPCIFFEALTLAELSAISAFLRGRGYEIACIDEEARKVVPVEPDAMRGRNFIATATAVAA